MDYGRIRQQGEQANHAGETKNPYPPGTSPHQAWQAGWEGNQHAAKQIEAEREAMRHHHNQQAELWKLWNAWE